MTSNADIGPNVQVLEISHPGLHTLGLGPVMPRVTAKPIVGWTMAAFTGDALSDLDTRGQVACWHGMEWRVANRTGRGLRRRVHFQNLRQTFRPGRLERGIGAGMVEIVFGPNSVLFFVVSSATMTTGGTTALRTDKGGQCRLARIFRGWRNHGARKTND